MTSQRRSRIHQAGLVLIVFASLAAGPHRSFANDTAASQIDDNGDPVLGLSFRGQHRAYPLKHFGSARAINDSIRQQEVLVFHNPELGISMAYFRVVLGEPIRFAEAVKGTVGDDLTTITRWDLSSGKAIGGNLLGMELIPMPVIQTSWAKWNAVHPETTVFSPGQP